MPEVPRQVHDTHPFILLRELREEARRRVATAVVHEQELEVQAERGQLRTQGGEPRIGER